MSSFEERRMKSLRIGLFAGAVGCALAVNVSAAEVAPGPRGTVFSLDLNTGTEMVLHSFVRKEKGIFPMSALTPVGEVLYGTTEAGGASRGGTVFAIYRRSGAKTIVHTFNGGLDGFSPDAGLIKLNGLLYGTTDSGGGESCGGSGCGTVYSIDPGSGKESVVYSFKFDGDGNSPGDALIAVGGKLYGTTLGGGSSSCGCGTVFAVDPASGAETVLYSLTGGTDGAWPYAGLVNVSGTLYGTTCCGGGNSNTGTVFAVDSATGAESVVYSFQNGNDVGESPYAGLVKVGGRLYGTTCLGGPGGGGTVFSLNPGNGRARLLHGFQYSDGECPHGLIDVAGTLYGTTEFGGSDNYGTVFSITTSGTETTIHAFDHKDGADPVGNLLYLHGKLYGTTTRGGRSQ
jgi:uncharacterized repeat protein (TIGR03803 family)